MATVDEPDPDLMGEDVAIVVSDGDKKEEEEDEEEAMPLDIPKTTCCEWYSFFCWIFGLISIIV